MPTATQNEASKLPTPEIRKCFAAGGTCAFTSTWAAIDVSTGSIPPFIVQTGTTDELTVTPIAASHISSWTL